MDDTLIAAGGNKSIRIYEIKSNEINRIANLEEHQHFITCLLFSKKHNWLISGGSISDKTIRLWKKITIKNGILGKLELIIMVELIA